ncbi:MAG: hypothetical protein V1820_00710, partial [archaeon]
MPVGIDMMPIKTTLLDGRKVYLRENLPEIFFREECGGFFDRLGNPVSSEELTQAQKVAAIVSAGGKSPEDYLTLLRELESRLERVGAAGYLERKGAAGYFDPEQAILTPENLAGERARLETWQRILRNFLGPQEGFGELQRDLKQVQELGRLFFDGRLRIRPKISRASEDFERFSSLVSQLPSPEAYRAYAVPEQEIQGLLGTLPSYAELGASARWSLFSLRAAKTPERYRTAFRDAKQVLFGKLRTERNFWNSPEISSATEELDAAFGETLRYGAIPLDEAVDVGREIFNLKVGERIRENYLREAEKLSSYLGTLIGGLHATVRPPVLPNTSKAQRVFRNALACLSPKDASVFEARNALAKTEPVLDRALAEAPGLAESAVIRLYQEAFSLPESPDTADLLRLPRPGEVSDVLLSSALQAQSMSLAGGAPEAAKAYAKELLRESEVTIQLRLFGGAIRRAIESKNAAESAELIQRVLSRVSPETGYFAEASEYFYRALNLVVEAGNGRLMAVPVSGKSAVPLRLAYLAGPCAEAFSGFDS